MKLARWVYLIAGILGLLKAAFTAFSVLDNGQEIAPELNGMGLFFFVFLIQYACWQILYLIIARDPERYRAMMIPAFLVTVISVLNPVWLFLFGYSFWILMTVVDIALALLFLVTFWLTGREHIRRSA